MIDFGQLATGRTDCLAIAAIAKRAASLDVNRDHLSLVMDLELTHHLCPLDLVALLKADEGNFLHDVCGIVHHLDRDTGELGDCFLPRFAL